MPYNPNLGTTVIRPPAALGAAANHNIFTITGVIVITNIQGRVVTTAMDATPSTLILTHTVAPTNLCTAVAAIANNIVGTIYNITGVLANAMFITDQTTAGVVATAAFMIPIFGMAGSIYYTNSGAQIGVVQWEISYRPFTSNGLVVAV